MAASNNGCIEPKPTSQTVYIGELPINLSAIARLTNVDQGYLSRIFSGQQSPSLKTAEKIAAALGMGLESFLQSIPKKSIGQ